MIALNASFPLYVKALVWALAEEWNIACGRGYVLYAGSCDCEMAQKVNVFQTYIAPKDLCMHHCGKEIELVPLMMYEGKGKWKLTEKNSEGEYTSRIVSFVMETTSQSVHGATSQ